MNFLEWIEDVQRHCKKKVPRLGAMMCENKVHRILTCCLFDSCPDKGGLP